MNNTVFRQSVDKGLKWIENNMLSYNRASWGIYERIRIDINQRVCWTRPDCNAEFLCVLANYRTVYGDEQRIDIYKNIARWLKSVQNVDGSFDFYYLDGHFKDEAGKGLWQNDNGKILLRLTELYRLSGDADFLDMAEKLAAFWIGIQADDGIYFKPSTPYLAASIHNAPCGILWLTSGMYKLFEATGNKKYLQSGENALGYVLNNLVLDGRVKTAFECHGSEQWRPMSSENAMALYNFSVIYSVTKNDKLLPLIDMLTNLMGQLQHESGAILNRRMASVDDGTSLQDGGYLCDLVYTQGFALQALLEAFTVTKNPLSLSLADKLAKFLISVQCDGESAFWDGGWRGSYDAKSKQWDGRCNQQNEIDEGGKYSVYTGWCATNIMLGLMALDEIQREQAKG